MGTHITRHAEPRQGEKAEVPRKGAWDVIQKIPLYCGSHLTDTVFGKSNRSRIMNILAGCSSHAFCL
jgi:hypothetical protein